MAARRRPTRPEGKGAAHNSLFSPGPNTDLNACVGWNGGPAGFDRYADGYVEAAKRIVKSLQEDSWNVDCLIYPLVSCYRHGIEIYLKHLAMLLQGVCDDESQVKHTHKLIDNWGVVRRGLSELEVENTTLARIELLLRELIQIDPNGEAFRYPETKDREMHLQNSSLFNVEVLAAGMDELTTFFSNFSSWVSELRDLKAECEYESERY